MHYEVTEYPPQASHGHTHTVIFLHGRGDSVPSFVNSLEHLQDSQGQRLPHLFPSFRWVFPQAHRKSWLNPSADTWPQWFDNYNTRDFSEREEVQIDGLRYSVNNIRQIIARECQILNGRSERIILAGISQGGATLLHTWFNLDTDTLSAATATTGSDSTQGSNPPTRRLGALLGFSCRLPFMGRSLTELRQILALDDVPGYDDVVRNTPVLLEHCVNDQTVPVELGRGLRDTLGSFGANVTWNEYPSGGHWFNSPQGVDDLREFINLHVLNVTGAA